MALASEALTEARFIKLCENGITAGPSSDEMIFAAQTELEIEFPVAYRSFLRQFGAMLGDGIQIYGLFDSADPESDVWTDVVSTTVALRHLKQVGVDRVGLLPISDDGMGSYFLIDCNVPNLGKVWGVGPGADQVVAPDIAQFALNYTAGLIVL